jgi:hypothetical protein
MIYITTSDRAAELPAALSEQLAARGQHYELVVVREPESTSRTFVR